MAHFVGGAHLGSAFVVVGLDGVAHLAYHVAMEREEAAATGLPVLDPASVEDRCQAAGGRVDPAGRVLGALELVGIQPPGRLALAGRSPAGEVAQIVERLRDRGWEVVSGDSWSRLERKRKGDREVAEIRRAARGACAAMREVASRLARAETRGTELLLHGEALTVGSLRRAIRRILGDHGLSEPRGNIVAAGGDGAVPHNSGDDDRALRPGESLVVDLFPRGRLFADVTRTFCVGPPSEAVERAHREVVAALAEARRRAAPGVSGGALQAATCDRFEAAGYPTLRSDPRTERGYVHGLGHGVGLELHELPSFRLDGEEEGSHLAVGDVFTLEPGLYDPAAGWGVRQEDLCRLGDDGLEVLTPLPQELDPRAW